MKEFSIEEIKAFVDKGYQSVSARYAAAALKHIYELQLKLKECEDRGKKKSFKGLVDC